MDEATPHDGLQGETPFGVAPPRPSIFHVMLWTLCSAGYLALSQAVEALDDDLLGEYASIRRASAAMNSVTIGATLMGAIILSSMRLRSGSPVLRHPGHWLLVVTAIAIGCSFLSWALPVLLVQDAALGNMIRWSTRGLIYLFSGAAYAFAARRSDTLRWKVFFAALVVWHVAYGLFCVAIGLQSMGLGNFFTSLYVIMSPMYLAICVWLAVVALIDLVSGRGRDWLHWTGIVTGVAAAGTTLLWWIGSWFVR